jgi:transcriptional regulator with XRE-family HTH domain
MAEISLVRGKSADPKRFEQFKTDLPLLLKVLTQEELAKGMGIKRSNINKYIKGSLPITRGFLNKFYHAWGHRIEEEAAKMRHEDQLYPQISKKEEPSLTAILTILQRIEKKIDAQSGQPPEEN